MVDLVPPGITQPRTHEVHSEVTSADGSRPQRKRRGGHHRGRGNPAAGAASAPSRHQDSQNHNVQHPENVRNEAPTPRDPRRPRRGANTARISQAAPPRAFGGRLTSAVPEGGDTPGLNADAPAFVPGQTLSRQRQPKVDSQPPRQIVRQRRQSRSHALDLPTRIHEDIDNGNYECVICSSEVVRTSRVWSCTTCWTVAHFHCTKKWHESQTTKNTEADHGPAPSWRCPGCNSSLTETPVAYHCWCGKEHNPRSTAGLPPHSCGQSCSKARGTCPHPCPLSCHAGPCPPCGLMGPVQTCFCGKHTSQKRCAETEYSDGFSCQELCGDLLPCGEHTCPKSCHAGLCSGCETLVSCFCYCGKEHRYIECGGRGDVLDSWNYGQLVATPESPEHDNSSSFEGSFECKVACGRDFDCNSHICEKDCHPQEETIAHCPFSADVVTHCPCSKTSLSELVDQPRTHCTDVIPRCDKVCGKLLPCGHECDTPCHAGPCGACLQPMDITCRCGRTSATTMCHQGDVQKPMCFRVCKAQLGCGRHVCGEHCCPAEKAATKRQAQSRSRRTTNHIEVEDEHVCTRQCDQLLKCGQHRCEQLCHRGACPTCLHSVFDEISCACGRTILQPPQPCGTRSPECRYDCTRRPRCGHSAVQHNCHPNDVDCPKCPFLVEKPCICGKRTLKNQPCWFEDARCGLPCGKMLKCGAHSCQKLCHKPGDCEDIKVKGTHCAQPCGKQRKSCEHECVDQCHAPHACKEDKTCQLDKFVTCDCQRKRQTVKCLATRSNPDGPPRDGLRCDDECARLIRNRQLAEALKIDAETHSDSHIPYQDITLKLFREDLDWAQEREQEIKTFAETHGERYKRFRPMKARQRQFLHVLAKDYGMDTESQDPEPHRHVILFKGPGFVSAPLKGLMQSLRLHKLLASQPKAAAPAASAKMTKDQASQSVFNALLITLPKFGLTIEDVESAIAHDVSSTQAQHPLLKHTVISTNFLPSDEVLIKASPSTNMASIASISGTNNPQTIETALAALKLKITKTISHLELAAGVVLLCHADGSLNITRREGDMIEAGITADGWNRVAGKAAARPRQFVPAAGIGARVPSHFVALKKPKKVVNEVVEVKPTTKAVGESMVELTGESAGETERESVEEHVDEAVEGPEQDRATVEEAVAVETASSTVAEAS